MSRRPRSTSVGPSGYGFTEYGRSVLTELRHLRCLTLTIVGDNSGFNKRLADEHEARKAEALDELRRLLAPTIAAGCDPEISYTGKSGAEENEEYTGALEKFISESVVTRAVDLYHWYIRRVLQLALNRDRSLIRGWAATLELSKKKVAEIESSASTAQALSSIFRGRESVFRKLVHNYLNVPDLGTMPCLVEVRNCIVHHCGDDIEGRVAAGIVDCPELGIEVRDAVIHVGPSAAFEAVGRAFSSIGLFDRMLANILALPTSTAPVPNLRRVYS